MRILKHEIKHLIQIVLTWMFINFAANLIGLWIAKSLNEAVYEYPESIFFEFVAPILVQSILFGICTALAFIYLKKNNLSYYAFTAFQFVIFHIMFLLNLRINHGLHFVSTFKNIGVEYLTYFGQYLVDVLYLYFPINGNFQNGAFAPDNLGTIYIHWILLVIVYYLAISWLSIKMVKYFFGNTVINEVAKPKEIPKEEENL